MTYRVRPAELDQFDQAMAAVGKARRRTGGYSWGLYRHGADSDLRVEQFTVASWSDYKRQTTERWTESDHQLITAALSHTVTGATEEERQLFAVGPRTGRHPARAGEHIDHVGELNGTAEREELRHGSTVKG